MNRSINRILHAYPTFPVQAVRTSRLAKFATVGGLGMAINTSMLHLLHAVMALPLVPASVLSIEFAIINQFYWNNRWTFQRTDISVVRFLRFNTVSLGGLFLNTSVLWILVTAMDVHYIAGNFVGICAAAGWNFGMSVFWTWRKSP